MVTKLFSRNLLLIYLFVSIFISALFVYHNTKPNLLMSKDTTYFLPGQHNNCLWIIKLDNNIRNKVGSSSEIKIGIPQAQKMGYLAGTIEVGRDQTLILAFNPPGTKKDRPPVIMTADYSLQNIPIKSIRFRWIQSSVITVVMFDNRKTCIDSRAVK